MPIRPVIALLRSRQWIKNVFVLAPLFFAGQFMVPELVMRAAAATIIFCLVSSLVYVFNDLVDAQSDSRHPVKSRTRPLASGALSRTHGTIIAIFLLMVVAAGSSFMPSIALPVIGYILLNALYSLVLKRIPIWDLFCIASGFVLRVYAGALAIDVPVSPWMFVTTLALALFLASGKRLAEIQVSDQSRPALSRYSQELLERYTEMSATAALLFYSLFVVTTRTELMLTIPIVMLGIFRYWYLLKIENRGESPTDALLADRQLMSIVFAWVVTCGIGLYYTGPMKG